MGRADEDEGLTSESVNVEVSGDLGKTSSGGIVGQKGRSQWFSDAVGGEKLETLRRVIF